MTRYRLTIAYDGTDFCGWQKQHPPGSEPLRTVQGVVERAVAEIVRGPVNLVGASRTDSGVHAIAQTAAFDAELTIPIERLARAVNSRLPGDVQIRQASVAPADFNPIADCVAKGYRYSWAHGTLDDADAPLFDRKYVNTCPQTLDVARMNEAAAHFVGEHDFTSMTRLHHGRESTVREVYACGVCATGPHRCHLDISGNGFLYNMVRIVAGTLVEVGIGAIEPDDVPGILEAKDRRAAGKTLPPEGLCLRWIQYSGESRPGEGDQAGGSDST